ncbi:MAG TPA: CATRA conflict system CASPASE/TPR repeat-associated protein, partial [Streptosporangiaceae bacterium]|nr:CATRA conflict system CASPASE/TPR repeat-associated protein [Streptosporangiaceae bacterium]
DSAIPALGLPSRLPRPGAVRSASPGPIAAAERRAAETWQALVSADHDLLRVTVMMAPPRDLECSTAWLDLERAWGDIVRRLPPDGLVGEARLLIALTASGDHAAEPGAAIMRTLEVLRDAVPAPVSVGWWRHWDTVRIGQQAGSALIWEIGPDMTDSRQVRRLVVVAPEELEVETDYLLWTDGSAAATPLTRHLSHAARLRRLLAIFADGEAASRLRDEIRQLLDAISGEPAEWEVAEFPGRLRRAQSKAVSTRATLETIRLAAITISDNMERALSLMTADVAVGPLSEDQHLASWLRRRLDNEILMLDTALRHALLASSIHPGSPVSEPFLARGMRPSLEVQAPCVVIFTAIAAEYEAIRSYLGGKVGRHAVRGTLYEDGELPGVRGGWRLVIVQTGQGSATAAVQLERAIHVFAPRVAFFVGVAGGRKDVTYGDVVVAEKIYDYESGKSAPGGFQPRMNAHKPSHQLVQHAQLVAREDCWQKRILPVRPATSPRAFVKPIATGAKVVTDDNGAVALLLERNASDTLAIETEGHGFLESAYVNPGVDALVIRGISDLLAGKDTDADTYWQPVASRHAAAFAVEMLDSLGASGAYLTT